METLSFIQSFLRRHQTALFWLSIAIVAALRLVYCFQLQVYTTDLNRNLAYGKAFSIYGFTLYDLTPYDLSPWPVQYLWPNHHYPYPGATLLFFAALAQLSTAVWVGKLALTALEAANAWLAYKITHDKWTALLLWCNPISIWFASREGQFEPWAAFWSLLAIYALRRGKPWALGALGVAVQCKLFPILLAPMFLMDLSWKQPKRLARKLAWALASLAPTVLASLQSDYMRRFLTPGYIPAYNPITWNLSDPALYPFFPFWLVTAHWAAGLLFVSIGLWGLWQTNAWRQFLAPLLQVVGVKANLLGQFWYLMVVAPFCVAIEDTRWRRGMLTLAVLLGIRSLYSILIGPVGYQNPPDAVYLIEQIFNGF